jgi:hypothetical protein
MLPFFQFLAALFQRHREAEDRRQGRAELMRDGREDRVAQRVELLALGDVLGRADHPQRPAVGVRDHAPTGQRPPHTSFGEDDSVVKEERLSFFAGPIDGVPGEVPILRVHPLEVGLERHLL